MRKTYAWRRFWARGFDFFLLFNIVLIFQIILSINFNKDIASIISIPIGFIGAILESILITLFGATPGKALLGLYVRNNDNSKLKLLKSIKRSFKVYGYGNALAIPILAPIAQFMTYKRLKSKGVAIWDDMENQNVFKKNKTFLRSIFFVLFFLFMIMFFFGVAPAYYTIR